MTNEQINAAIAEACGWTEIQDSGVWHHHKLWGYPPLKPEQCGNSFHYLPDYCNDLNAMHQAEKVLNKEQVREYQCYMYDMACEIQTTHGRWMPYSATARYRAEAFLRTLGKWEEVQK